MSRNCCPPSCGNANSPPALGVLVIVAVAGYTIYRFRQAIITTVELAVLSIVCVAGLTAVIALTVSTVRWYRRRAAAQPIRMLAVPVRPGVPAQEPAAAIEEPVQTIAAEAQWLAAEGTELAFSPDGKTLQVRQK
jgi:hypothetical protein